MIWWQHASLLRITYFFKLFTYHCESLVDTFCRPCDGHNSFRTRTVWYVYLSTTLKKHQQKTYIYLYNAYVWVKSRKTCTCNYIIKDKETYIFSKLLNIISFLKNTKTILLIKHLTSKPKFIFCFINFSFLNNHFDIKA